MSIIGEVTQPPGPHDQIMSLVFFAIIALVAAVLAWWVGVFRRGSINGPSRVDDNEPIGLVALLLGLGVVTWFFGQFFCGILIGIGNAAAGGASRPTTVATASALNLTPGQLALAASVPGLFAFFGLVLANRLLRRRGLADLGLSSRFMRGVLMGLLGSLIAVPFTFFAAQATEIVWQLLHVQHPQEHDLLRVLGESKNPISTAVLIAAAVLFAPLFEEMIFRGHLQTLITHGLSRLTQRRDRQPVAAGFDIMLPGGEIGHVQLPPAMPPLAPPMAWMRWVSIAITSVLFALVHIDPSGSGWGALWMIPPIFILSMCLGYAYERTGNLWTNIIMHMMFNTTSTIIFLFAMH